MEGLAPSRPPTVHAEMQFPPRQEVTMTALRLVTVLGTLALSAAAPGFPIFNPAQFVWKPKDALPPGAHGAVVRGREEVVRSPAGAHWIAAGLDGKGGKSWQTQHGDDEIRAIYVRRVG